ncbi:hypothetical protein BC936DRAFT_137476 [Jimgerdemannia flammicorona]|uniref:Spondin domain-containing protein n=1 Tax=Jimgerdemannia flammicorona TaxID=994334 RepID=A0A433DJ30_9FUNG|nr:hypothetical protein BC936DRAFT_137476 [Jimgerdemannia flammicorona]
MLTLRFFASATLFLVAIASPVDHVAQTFAITVENLSYKQIFTPVLTVIHEPSVTIFKTGTPASLELQYVAEDGNATTFVQLFESGLSGICGWSVGSELTFPGKTYNGNVTITKPCQDPHISIVSMLGISNDAFTGISSVPLDVQHKISEQVTAYDAGTEENNEDCVYVGACAGSHNLRTPGLGEGFVHVHRGIHGLNVTKPGLSVEYDWRFPVAYITVSST